MGEKCRRRGVPKINAHKNIVNKETESSYHENYMRSNFLEILWENQFGRKLQTSLYHQVKTPKNQSCCDEQYRNICCVCRQNVSLPILWLYPRTCLRDQCSQRKSPFYADDTVIYYTKSGSVSAVQMDVSFETCFGCWLKKSHSILNTLTESFHHYFSAVRNRVYLFFKCSQIGLYDSVSFPSAFQISNRDSILETSLAFPMGLKGDVYKDNIRSFLNKLFKTFFGS